MFLIILFSARSSSQATLDSLEMTRYSEDGDKMVNERVAILEFELRKAKDTINALRTNLTVAAVGNIVLNFKINIVVFSSYHINYQICYCYLIGIISYLIFNNLIIIASLIKKFFMLKDT